LTNKSVDAASEKIWSNAGYTYLVLYTTSMKEYTKVQKLLEYIIKWTLTDISAAFAASKLGYSVLHAAV
jgi:hypothetical protein